MTLMVDPGYDFVSNPFNFGETFVEVGNYHELKNQNDPLGIHRRIRKADLLCLLYGNRGVNFNDLGQHAQAIAELTKAIKRDRNNADAYSNRGAAYTDLGQLPEANADYNKTIEVDPKHATAYLNRGINYSTLGRRLEAIADFTKTLEFDPNNAKAYGNRGLSYFTSGQFAAAKEDLQKAISLSHDEKLKALIEGALKQIDDASRNASTNAVAVSVNAADYFNRGVANLRSGRNSEAAADLTKAIELNPRLTEAYLNRGIAYSGLGQHSQAISDSTKAIELDPKDDRLYGQRGLFYVNAGKFVEAKRDLEKAIELSQDEKFKEGMRNAIKQIDDVIKGSPKSGTRPTAP
jgi:tetratricopeptide (TPR) repeat protein